MAINAKDTWSMKFVDFVSRDAIRTGVEADAKEDVIRAMAASLLEAGKVKQDQFEGIVEAIRTYHTKGLKISLYVFGDEFTGSSIDQVVKTVDFMNREDTTGERRVRIHAIGFPVRPDAPQYTSIRFATLMRILCQRNGGTFVGIEKS